MTAEWYDLAQRCYAARSGRPVPRLLHSPIPTIANPVAVRAQVGNGSVRVAVAAPGAGKTRLVALLAVALAERAELRVGPGNVSLDRMPRHDPGRLRPAVAVGGTGRQAGVGVELGALRAPSDLRAFPAQPHRRRGGSGGRQPAGRRCMGGLLLAPP